MLVFGSESHHWSENAAVLTASLEAEHDLSCTVESDPAIFASADLGNYDAIIFGSGFTRREGPLGEPGTVFHPEFTPEQEKGLLDFVRGGKGFFGMHAAAWYVGGEYVQLLGGHANAYPKMIDFPQFEVEITDPDHAITAGVGDFTLSDDECYLCAFFPEIRILATVTWSGKRWPVVWTHEYGAGRVFFTTLGHREPTFEHPMMERLLVNAAHWVVGVS
jgi:hypothetical protein